MAANIYYLCLKCRFLFQRNQIFRLRVQAPLNSELLRFTAAVAVFIFHWNCDGKKLFKAAKVASGNQAEDRRGQ